MLKCDKCKKEFPDKEVHESHDVPCYLFEGNRKGRENQADKFGRHLLCKNCHDKFEAYLKNFLRRQSILYSKNYFEEVKDEGIPEF
jgi:hypothetical protein